jgi:ubiquinone/menaquinone biosynthesis C-methylase UbiE
VPERQTHFAYVEDLIRPFGPRRAIEELVIEVNRIFHALDADQYDEEHPEIHQQLPAIWEEMLNLVSRARTGPWTLLDFGAGTGFATLQVAERIHSDSLACITCVDLSTEMLSRCRAKIAPVFPKAEFLESVPDRPNSYNLLVTNSVLHHIPDVAGTVAALERVLKADAWWVAGHEPSSRFYVNDECIQAIEAYRRRIRWLKFFRPAAYARRLRRLRSVNPLVRTAHEAVARGLFERPPTATIIDRLTDFGVAHSREEAEVGRGLDFHELAHKLAGRWTLRYVKTYNFMGDRYEASLPRSWQAVCRDLRNRFPDDGANFSAVWQRVHQTASG